MKEWYRCSADEVLRELGTSSAGLNRKEVIRRRRQFGENRVTESRKDPPWKIFFKQYQDLLVMILLAAAVISFLTDNGESTLVIFLVVTMNAALGTAQQVKARKSLESLKRLSAPHAATADRSLGGSAGGYPFAGGGRSGCGRCKNRGMCFPAGQ